ncbi:hypothetical protein NKI44_27110 [Mesorhizobium sp. M0614]|uniref:hypothetical protein n=1 Tax=unclassified Mesorhizobium TaxID=325217 RepID=UPI0033366348
MKGPTDDHFFGQIREQLRRYEPLHVPVTRVLADSYGRQAKAARGTPRPKNPVLPGDAKEWARINAPLATMGWKDFVIGARADPYHDFEKRMKLLRTVQQMFFKTSSFSGLSGSEWKGIAGILGATEAQTSGLDDVEWGWFGSMGGAGTFKELIGLQDAALAKALDSIPKRGTGTEEQFDNYSEAFTKAFVGFSRTARFVRPPDSSL